jgi:hypothetical protein
VTPERWLEVERLYHAALAREVGARTKLRRDVAIKILPGAFIADPEREARMLAVLNHPNIAAIYGIEEGSAVDERR